MTNFTQRYNGLNARQRQAVDTIDGALLVLAGPGTGKTELLSMRAANILQKTDTRPENILLLTFTESGATAMRERLRDIIGPDAYKVAIHTFHSFGTDIIAQNREYFYNGATYKPADEITSHELLQSIFDTLDYANPLASKNNGEYVYLRDTATAISELKTAGLTNDELLQILDANDQVYDKVERELSAIFDAKIHISMLAQLAPLAQIVAELPQPKLPLGVTPMANILALSMAHAIDSAASTNKTTPITAWRNEWLEKNTEGRFIFKDRKRSAKLRAVAYVYFMYLTKMNEQGLFDYDDMILTVIHALETNPDLRATIQEQFQYILVDEFQDTNLAQLRLLFDISAGEQPNVMAVGDDDQAIYSFQGADSNNIHKFRAYYGEPDIIVLTDNYRSGATILHHAREVITQGTDRLEATIPGLTKELAAQTPNSGTVTLHEVRDTVGERAWLSRHIASAVASGVPPEQIAVIARRHSELMALVPYLNAANLAVNYERRDNVLDNDVVRTTILISSIIIAQQQQDIDTANALLPELVAHPAFSFAPADIWQLSLNAYRNHQKWIEAMLVNPTFAPLANWLITLAKDAPNASLERMVDVITGTPDTEVVADFTSPLFAYYFDIQGTPTAYLEHIESLRSIRAKLREYNPTERLTLADFLAYIDAHSQAGIGITSVRKALDTQQGAINLLTAHKSKGLEFTSVYVMGAVDSSWGEKVRVKSRLLSYPKNLAIAPVGDTYTERLRLFYVAMTRAKEQLAMSYAATDQTGKTLLPAAFLTGTSLTANTIAPPSTQQALSEALIDWRHSSIEQPNKTLHELLKPTLEAYKLSATHLNNFLDVTKGGPQYFLLNNLLHFPSAKSPSAQYGTAIHTTLQRVHNEVKAGIKRPIEDILQVFQTTLEQQHLEPADYEMYAKKGLNSLTKFLEAKYHTFTTTQKTELGFGAQGVVVQGARLTGSLDLVDITNRTITVTDYKTGTPARSWKGTTEYEKIKLHHYRQQLMFYQLLVQNSRSYANYNFAGGILQFVEPDSAGTIHTLEAQFAPEELHAFARLITGVWNCIIALDLPDATQYEPNLKGILAFEQAIIDKTDSLS